MDLLGRTHLRLSLRSPALQTDKIARIRECESGSRAGAFGWETGETHRSKWQCECEQQGVVAGRVTNFMFYGGHGFG